MVEKKLKVILVIFLLLKSYVFGQSPKQQLSIANSAKLASKPLYEEIPFTNKAGYTIIPVKIGESTYEYILDTGGFNTVTSSIMKEVNLSPLMEVETGSSNKIKSKIKLAKVPSLQIGKAIFQDVGVFNFDFSASPIINCYTNGGLIGKSVIREAVWQIDYQKSVIRISDDLSKMPFISEDQKIKVKFDKTLNPFVTLSMNGKKETFMLDWGYAGLVSLTEKTAHALPLNKYITIEGEGDVSANGVVKENTFVTKIDNLTIGKTELKNQVAYYSKSNNHNLLGAELAKYFIVTLNFKDEELILMPYNNIETDFETFGFSMNIDSRKLYVSKIFEGLNAQKSGLMVNDEIIGVNEQTWENASLCERYFNFSNILKTEKEITIRIKRSGEEKAFTIMKQKPF